MKKNLIITFIVSILICANTNARETTIIQNSNFQIKTEKTKLVVINGKLYKLKNGKFIPLLGIAIKFIGGIVLDEIKTRAMNHIQSFLAEKEINVVDDNLAKQEDVEEIIINIEDVDSDGIYEISSETEDHNGDGEEDNGTELHEFEDFELGLEQNLITQIEFFDQFYQGDLDGDGNEN